MKNLAIIAALTLLTSVATAGTTTADADDYNATAFFTSGVVGDEPIDQLDTAYLDQDKIILYVDWDNLEMRAYRTEVWIVNPNGTVIGKVRNVIKPVKGRNYTYYYFQPLPDDTPGDWTYQVYVDGQSAFEARIPVLASK